MSDTKPKAYSGNGKSGEPHAAQKTLESPAESATRVSASGPPGKKKKPVRNAPLPDAVLKNYFSDPARFADLVNAFFWSNERPVDPVQLEKCETMVSTMLDRDGQTSAVERRQDVAYRWYLFGRRNDRTFVTFGLENQMWIDPSMASRIGVAAEIRHSRDIAEIQRNYKRRPADPIPYSPLGNGEFLNPIVFLVVYLGDQGPWNAPSTLEPLFGPDIPDSVKKVAHMSRPIHVFDATSDELSFRHPDNVALFGAVRATFASGSREERAARIKECLSSSRVADDAYARIFSSRRVMAAKSEGGKIDMVGILEETEQELMEVKARLKEKAVALEEQNLQLEAKDVQIAELGRGWVHMLREMGKSLDEICAITGLSPDTVQGL